MTFRRKCLLICMTLALLSLPPAARGGELEDAHLVYAEKYAFTGEGVHSAGGLLFVIAAIPREKETTPANTLLAKAMLRGKKLLQEYTAEHLLDESKRPPPCLLKAVFPRSIAFGRESTPGLGLPAFDINVTMRVLESREIKEREYRYAIVLRLDDLKANIPAGLYGEPSREEVAAALRKTWAARKKNGSLGELCRAFGLAEDLLRIGDPDAALSGGAAEELAGIARDNAAQGLPKGIPPRSPGIISPLTIAWEHSGRADFSVMNAVLPQEYRTAGQLYGDGVELPRIIMLAARSAELAPAAAAAWLILGQALIAGGQTAAAVPFLVQSLRLDPENADTRAFLAMAYKAGGRYTLAKGMAASALFACGDGTEWGTAKAVELLSEIHASGE